MSTDIVPRRAKRVCIGILYFMLPDVDGALPGVYVGSCFYGPNIIVRAEYENKVVFVCDTDIWAVIYNVSVRMDVFLRFEHEICDVKAERFELQANGYLSIGLYIAS